jgi:alternate signal-mediated exported protein
MKKLSKGVLASAAAGSLLLGGAGSLAYWTASDTVNGGSFASGSLKLVAVGCDTNWKYAPGKTGAGNTVNLIVPGDVITKNCTFTVTGTGDHLSAKITSPATVNVSAPGTTTWSATDATTYAIGGTNARTLVDGDNITSADNGQTLTATFTVTIPYGDATTTNANDTQLSTASLDQLTVSLTQNNPN